MNKEKRLAWINSPNTKLSAIAKYTAYCLRRAIKQGYRIVFITVLNTEEKCCCPMGSVLLNLNIDPLTVREPKDNPRIWKISDLALHTVKDEDDNIVLLRNFTPKKWMELAKLLESEGL